MTATEAEANGWFALGKIAFLDMEPKEKAEALGKLSELVGAEAIAMWQAIAREERPAGDAFVVSILESVSELLLSAKRDAEERPTP